VEHADIVVESSRPRALLQLGVDAESLVNTVPGLTWVSITGYGRREPGAGWVAFGDDAGVAAGLATATGGSGGPPLFCGDAIADPLTGLHAALAALACWRGGGGYLLDLALRDVVAHAGAFGPAPTPARVGRNGSGWEVAVERQRSVVRPPRARPVRSPARRLGADTERVVEEFALPC
jgi:crotonobetainyl-CoA:carnitine CoA-transferase CaiB-like acyl-CoA transferase